MKEFIKEYFHISHDENGYLAPKANKPTKVTKKERMIWIITCYMVLALSFLIYLTNFSLLLKILWQCIIISLPITFIMIFDFNVIKIIKLYLYSKSKNINKNIIYESYMSDTYDKGKLSGIYRKKVYDVFINHKKKHVVINSNTYRLSLCCSWKNCEIFLKVKPRKLIVTINGNTEVIKNNKNTFEEILLNINKKITTQ